MKHIIICHKLVSLSGDIKPTSRAAVHLNKFEAGVAK